MKKVVNVGIGGKSFTIDEDAYQKLKKYLKQFRNHTKMGIQTKEVMNDLEERIAELFIEKRSTFKDVVSIEIVNAVIAQLGMPDGSPFIEDDSDNFFSNAQDTFQEFVDRATPTQRKLFRDPAQKAIGGVASGLAHYFGADILLIRVLFVLAFIMGLSAGFWIYIILWIAVPLADTPARKCQMFGLPVTAENLRRFTNER